MATRENLEFKLGADWPIMVDCRDRQGGPLDLTGGNLRFRMTAPDGTVLIDLDKDAGVTIDPDPATGVGLILVAPGLQAGVNPGIYPYEIWAELSGGAISDQVEGVISAVAGSYAA